MDLIIGGAFQGKTEYVKKHFGIDEDSILECNENTIIDGGIYKDKCLIDNVSCVIRLNEWILSQLKYHGEHAQEEIDAKLNAFIEDNPDIIIVMDEVGYGIVPLDKNQRDYRELVGRTGCLLASKARKVIRVVCGNGQIIKEK